MFGHGAWVAGGVVVAAGVDDVAVRAASVDAGDDEPPAACAITKPPIPEPASKPAASRAAAAILREPRARGAGCAVGGGGGVNWSPSIGVYLLVVD